VDFENVQDGFRILLGDGGFGKHLTPMIGQALI
jgi:hypothetical protein